MNSFNNIEKIKYTSEKKEELVSLLEYIIFVDERQEQKYTILKLQNNLNQFLFAVQLEISQYDEEQNLITKSTISYDGFIAKEKESFVPKARLALDYRTKTISMKLVGAQFEKMKFENGECIDVPLEFSEYSKEVGKKKDNNKKKQKKKKEKKQKKSTRRYVVEEMKNRNKTKMPYIFNGIFAIAFIGFVSYFTISTRFSSASDYPTIMQGSYKYQQINKTECKIIKYYGTASDYSLPETIGKYKVVEIADSAFKDNNSIVTLHIDNDVKISSLAFSKCTNLNYIVGDAQAKLYEFSFSNCYSLQEVNLPNASIYPNAFLNDNSISNFTFGKPVNCKQFGNIFGLDNISLPSTLEFVTCNTKVSDNFFENMSAIVTNN